MKKKIILFIIVGIILILSTPIKNNLKDGGSVEYKSLTYKITHLKQLDENYKNGYKEGTVIELFGKKIYERINSEKIKQNELIVYEKDGGGPHNPYTYCCKTDKIYKKIKTETDNAEILDISPQNKYFLIKDGKLKIYNNETEELTLILLEANYELYILQTLKETDELIGITYYADKENYIEHNVAGFYNLKTNKKMYDMQYSVINIIDNQTLETVKKEQTNKYILDINEELIFKEETIER